MHRLAAYISIVAAMAGAAQAAPEPSNKPAQSYVNLQPVGLPAIIHGRLVNYIFTDVRLVLAKGVDAAKLQEQEPFLRDALVRAATRTPFNPPQDGVRLDETRLKAEILKDAAVEVGAGKVVGVEIRSQTPQHRAGIPGGG